MYDRAILLGLFRKILWSVEQTGKRIEPLRSGDDFLKSDTGLEKLGSICMQLIAIGETLKQRDKVTGGELLQRYPEVDWKSAKGMGDIITHHSFDIDAEAVFNTCVIHIPILRKTVEKIIKDFEEGKHRAKAE